jgi:hypothetical protein
MGVQGKLGVADLTERAFCVSHGCTVHPAQQTDQLASLRDISRWLSTEEEQTVLFALPCRPALGHPLNLPL